MKNILKINLLLSAACVFASCGSGVKSKGNGQDSTTQQIINTGGTGVDTANASGSRYIVGNDCLTCHQINQKGFGPSYTQIANRYENNEGNVQNLADKIIKGGKGLWGQNAMTPHPNVPVPQAEAMVRYILSLRNSSDSTK